MTTCELIIALRKVDPNGNMQVVKTGQYSEWTIKGIGLGEIYTVDNDTLDEPTYAVKIEG